MAVIFKPVIFKKFSWGVSIVLVLLMTLIVLLQSSLWLGHSSIFASYQVSKQVDAQIQENQILAARNQNLFNQIEALKNNAEATEAKAREDLGLVKPGEIYYRYGN